MTLRKALAGNAELQPHFILIYFGKIYHDGNFDAMSFHVAERAEAFCMQKHADAVAVGKCTFRKACIAVALLESRSLAAIWLAVSGKVILP